ncbi:MAG: glycosyltransferase family 61 protein [Acidimicrobiia bacterium]
MSTGRERALDAVRRGTARVAGPLLTRHEGRVWLARRAITTVATELAKAGKPPAEVRAVTIAEALTATGVEVLRPEPGYPVLEIARGTVLGPWGHTAIAPGVVVADLSCGERRPDKRRTRRESANAFGGPLVEIPGTTANVAQNHFGNYANWLLRGAVRCEGVDATIGFAACDHVITGPLPGFAHELLAAYGVQPTQVVEMGREPAHYRCERLVAPGEPQDGRFVPRWAIERFRDRFGAPATSDAPRRVYLGRGDVHRRRVLNDDAVREVLDARGFVSVAMDGLTVREQAAMFAGAECVVAAHGAAMANLVFAPDDAMVVELVYRNWPVTIYRDVCATIGQRYVALPGREPELWGIFGEPNLIDADTVADVDALVATLDAAGVH